MTSTIGYNTPGDMRVFYPQTHPAARTSTPGSVLHYIYNEPRVSIFAYIVDRARLAAYFDDPEFKNTVFVPVDEHLRARIPHDTFLSMSSDEAYRIVRYSVIQGRIEYWLLQSLNYAALQPVKSHDRIEMYVHDGTVVLNGDVRVIPADRVCSNGVVLFIDGLLEPYNYS